jgi:resuscitation-promoting factor RpfA
MLRNTDESLTRAFTRRAAQVVLVGAMATAPLALGTGLASADTDWDELAQCESSGDWSTNTGNGFGGGLQFTDSTWDAFGGSGDPEDASRSEQIQVAERVKAEQGMNAWPTCSKKTGNTDDSANTGSSGSSDSGSSDSDSDSSETESIAAGGSTQQAQPTQAPAGGAYTVVSGDTLSSVAAAHNVSWQSVAQNNSIADPDSISPGQQLKMG